MKWAESVRQLPDEAQRAGLAIRLLERRLPGAPTKQAGWGKPESWIARAHWWLREDDAHQQMLRDLQDAAFEGVYGLPGRLSATGTPSSAIEAMMLPSKGDLEFEIRPKEIMEGLSDLSGELPPWSMATRIVLGAAECFAEGSAAAQRLEEHARRCDILLRRANRVRNAVIHGNNTVPAVVESVQPLLEQLDSKRNQRRVSDPQDRQHDARHPGQTTPPSSRCACRGTRRGKPFRDAVRAHRHLDALNLRVATVTRIPNQSSRSR